MEQNTEPRNRHTQENQLIFDKETKAIQQKKYIVFSTNGAGTIAHPHTKKKKQH